MLGSTFLEVSLDHVRQRHREGERSWRNVPGGAKGWLPVMLAEDLFKCAAVEATLDEQLNGLHQVGHGLGVRSPLARDGEAQALGDVPVSFLLHSACEIKGQCLVWPDTRLLRGGMVLQEV